MLNAVTLTRVDDIADEWLLAVARDYEIPDDARVFFGRGLAGENIAFWIYSDGSGFGAIDSDPKGYLRFSKNPNEYNHPGVDEYEFGPESYDYDARRLKVEASLSFGGL